MRFSFTSSQSLLKSIGHNFTYLFSIIASFLDITREIISLSFKSKTNSSSKLQVLVHTLCLSSFNKKRDALSALTSFLAPASMSWNIALISSS